MIDINLLNDILNYHALNFRVDSIILESGQRTAYKGYTLADKSPVVIKVSTHNEIRIARIQREICTLNLISSEYFPRFYSQAYLSDEIIGAYIDNLDVLRKEWIDHVRRVRPKPFLVTCEEHIEHIAWNNFTSNINKEYDLVEFLFHLFKALELLWNHRIVHRDIKPDNILVRPNNMPVIIDLGIAKSLRPGTRDLTLSGVAPCTPQYAAPEQFRTDSDVTYKADQFAVGIIMYHMLTGNYPYGKYDDIGIDGLLTNFAARSVKNIIDLNRSVNAMLANFIHKLIEIEPYKRFRSTAAIFNNLADIKRSLSC